MIRSVNWLAGTGLVAPRKIPSRDQGILLRELRQSFELLGLWRLTDVSSLDPVTLFNQKQVNGYGEEIHVARTVRWENVSEKLAEGRHGRYSARQPMSVKAVSRSIFSGQSVG